MGMCCSKAGTSEEASSPKSPRSPTSSTSGRSAGRAPRSRRSLGSDAGSSDHGKRAPSNPKLTKAELKQSTSLKRRHQNVVAQVRSRAEDRPTSSGACP
jgi:hypothetical protein